MFFWHPFITNLLCLIRRVKTLWAQISGTYNEVAKSLLIYWLASTNEISIDFIPLLTSKLTIGSKFWTVHSGHQSLGSSSFPACFCMSGWQCRWDIPRAGTLREPKHSRNCPLPTEPAALSTNYSLCREAFLRRVVSRPNFLCVYSAKWKIPQW